MIDTLRSDFPTDMTRAASDGSPAALESMAQDALDRVSAYAREHPAAFGLWALGVGFVLGWKLKPW
jgi:hypothetical protein